MSITSGSGAPRAKTSRPSTLRFIRFSDAVRMACRRCRRKASRAARSAGSASSDARRCGNQQARFQIGEPGGHHQIIGGKFKLQAARLLDEGQILLGQLQDRDLLQVHLVVAGEFEQQVERAFEAAEFDDQRARRPRPRGARRRAAALRHQAMPAGRLRWSGLVLLSRSRVNHPHCVIPLIPRDGG